MDLSHVGAFHRRRGSGHFGHPVGGLVATPRCARQGPAGPLKPSASRAQLAQMLRNPCPGTPESVPRCFRNTQQSRLTLLGFVTYTTGIGRIGR